MRMDGTEYHMVSFRKFQRFVVRHLSLFLILIIMPLERCVTTCLFTSLDESSLVLAGLLTAQFLKKT